MLKIYLKSALRHLSRSRLYAVINIVGLATGITVMLLAILFWRDENNFDKFHKNAPHLYRVVTTLREFRDHQFVTMGGTGQVQGPAFAEAIPEVRSFTRIFGGEFFTNVIAGNKTIRLQPFFVDANFLEVFSFPVIRGSAANALRRGEDVVLTESTALKLFNSTDVIGKLLELDAEPSYEKLGKPLVVSAVIKNPPSNSSLQFDILYSYPFMQLSFEDNNWLNAYMGTFLLLKPGSDIKLVETKMQQVFNARAKEQLSNHIKSLNYDPEVTLSLQRITDIHLNPHLSPFGNQEAGVINGSNKTYSIVFLMISGFILLMAAINFVNINLAGAIKRSKEVGVRKIAGGTKWQIIYQFLTEASLLCITAFAIGCLMVFLLLPLFNDLTAKELTASGIFTTDVIFYFILLLVLLIAVTSLYPSIILSRFRPAEVLYNRVTKSNSGFLGRMLVVVQFTPAIFLLIASIVYYSQMKYMRNKELGYNPSQVITTSIYGDRDYNSAIRFMQNEFAKEPLFIKTSFGTSGWIDRLEFNGKRFTFLKKSADENFLPLMEIPLVAGRNFTKADEDNGIIVNESFIRAAEIDYAPGALVNMSGNDERFSRRIVGVVKDYHHSSPRMPILPMVMFMKKQPDGDIWVKVDKANMKQGITALERIYKKAMPSALFEYNIMEEANAREFINDQRWQKAVNIGTVLSFIICWLGLFGLAHLTTYQRIKEIGIRKVLGASVSQIIILLTGQFVRLVLIAIAIASPVAWMVMSSWLNEYAYHINIGAGVFLIASAMAVSVTFISVSYQSFRSALMNPVKSLRTE